MPTRTLTVTFALLAAFLSTACSTSSQICGLTTCTINLTGEQQIKVGRTAGPYLRIGPIEPNTVTVKSGGDEARLSVGQRAIFSGSTVQVTSINGPHVSLEVK